MVHCKNCKWSGPDKDSYGRSQDESGRLLSCTHGKWITGYDTNADDIPSDGIWYENDEGWGARMGPEFGCVHGEMKDVSL